MRFLSLSVLGFVLIISKISSGCHNPLHGLGGGGGFGFGVAGTQGHRPSGVNPGDRIRQLLAGHDLPSDIIDCVVARQTTGIRSKRSFFDRIAAQKFKNVNPNSEPSLQDECKNNRQLCLDVLECGNGRVPQLNFLTPPKTTTTTTTTTTSTPFRIPNPFHHHFPPPFCGFFGCQKKK